jgi:hypothetical protein
MPFQRLLPPDYSDGIQEFRVAKVSICESPF